MCRKYKIKPFSTISNGNKIRGYVLKPMTEGPHPCVIVSHGMLSNMVISYSYAKVFAKLGYVAFCYDFTMSGSGISGGDSRGMSAVTESEDVINRVHYVKSLDYVDKNRIILAGCSQGGMASVLAAAKIEDEIERIILYYPALCIPDDARRGQMMNASFEPDKIPDEFRIFFVKASKKYADDVKDIDVNAEMSKFKKPVLIIHGKEDKLVKIDYSRSAAKAYKNCKLLEIHGDHGFIFFGKHASDRETRKYLKSL